MVRRKRRARALLLTAAKRRARRGILSAAKRKIEEKRLSDEEFVRLFRLIIFAFDHEIGGAIQSFLYSLKDRNEELPIIESLYHSYRRLGLLMSISKGRPAIADMEIYKGILSDEEKAKLKNSHNLDAVKEITLQVLDELSSAGRTFLTEYRAGKYSRFDFDKVTTCRLFVMPVLLDILRRLISHGDLSRDIKPTSINGLQGVSTFIGCVNDRCHYDLRFEGDDSQKANVLAHDVFLMLVFQNIFANAQRAMYTKDMIPELLVSVRNGGNRVVFEFEDKGCGIQPEIVRKLNSGIRVSTKDNSEPGEHGIGFRYSRELAREMGGNLYISESEIDKGTTVVLELKKI